jgi:hypothetical protein
VKKYLVFGMVLLITACSTITKLSTYSNANNPADRTGKEDWPLVQLDTSNVDGGLVLISTVRDDANIFQKMKSVHFSQFKKEALLSPDSSNSISVRYESGNLNATYTMINIKRVTLYYIKNEAYSADDLGKKGINLFFPFELVN